jgi:hypothetical protein
MGGYRRGLWLFLVSIWITGFGCARKAPPPGKPDLEAPVLEILYPADDDTVSDSVLVQTTVKDKSPIQSVALFVDGTLASSDSTDPYEPLWDTSELLDTSHTLYIQSVDRWDNRGRSSPIRVFTRNGNIPEPSEPKEIEKREKTEESDEDPGAE